MAYSSVNPTPTLDNKHSGIPVRLTEQAKRAKGLLSSRRTVSEAPKRRTLHLPPYTTRQKFDDAIAQLKKTVGSEWVHINDEPLIDGWYMEHPYDCQQPTNTEIAIWMINTLQKYS